MYESSCSCQTNSSATILFRAADEYGLLTSIQYLQKVRPCGGSQQGPIEQGQGGQTAKRSKTQECESRPWLKRYSSVFLNPQSRSKTYSLSSKFRVGAKQAVHVGGSQGNRSGILLGRSKGRSRSKKGGSDSDLHGVRRSKFDVSRCCLH